MAVAEVLPTVLEAVQVYWPPLAPVTMAMEYIGPLAPAIGAPWNCHDIWGSGFPSGMHMNCALRLRGTEILVGGWRMEGGSGERKRGGRRESINKFKSHACNEQQ